MNARLLRPERSALPSWATSRHGQGRYIIYSQLSTFLFRTYCAKDGDLVIIYDLKCEKGHTFEGWFKDRQACILQNSQKLISCPVCNSSSIEVIPSSITIIGKNLRAVDKLQEKELSPAKTLKILNQYIDNNFEDVGNKFAEIALKIHSGDEERRNIKGTSTPQEEENLKEEGVQFIKISLPKMDS